LKGVEKVGINGFKNIMSLMIDWIYNVEGVVFISMVIVWIFDEMKKNLYIYNKNKKNMKRINKRVH
jgi:hypothetical protein